MRAHPAIPFLLIASLGFVVYANSLNGAFVYDDNPLIVNNPYLQEPAKILTMEKGYNSVHGIDSHFFRPALFMSFALDYQFWQLRPFGYHLSNILYHVAAAMVYFALLRLLFGQLSIALIASLLFVAHPAHTEAVAYLSGRADPLAALGVLAALASYVKINRSKKISLAWFLLMAAAYAAALYCKEYALVLIPLTMIAHWVFKERFRWAPYLGLGLITVLYVASRASEAGDVLAHSYDASTLSQRVPGAFVALFNYFKVLIWPFDLHMEYVAKLFTPSDPRVWAGAAIFVSSAAAAFFFRKNKVLLFSVLWFYLTLLPVLNLFHVNAYMAEHWLYMPSMGIFALAAWAITQCSARYGTRLAAFLTAALVLFYSALTIHQNNYWKDPVTFYKRTLLYAPGSARIHNNLGNEYKKLGQYEAAGLCYEKALELNPLASEAHYNLGFIRVQQQRFNDALACYQKAIAINPRDFLALNNLGAVSEGLGLHDQALTYYTKALQVNPQFEHANRNRINLSRRRQTQQ